MIFVVYFQDIRKFFQPKTSPAPAKKRLIVEDDDDVIPESPDVQITNKVSNLLFILTY